MKNKKTLLIVIVCVLVIVLVGSTYAGWIWSTEEEQKTNVVFTYNEGFSCAVDGGGNITETDAFIAPTAVSDGDHVIKRTVIVTPTIAQDDLTIDMDLWINVDSIDTGLSDSDYFKYTLTTSSTNKGEGVVAYGNFNGSTAEDKIHILYKSYSSSTPETYYLWIWLGPEETSTSTMNQSFSLSLGGECTTNVRLYGDANLDGVVDENDSTLIIAYYNDEVSLTDDAFANADVTLDGVVDESDATYILQYNSGTISSLPVLCSNTSLCNVNVSLFGDVNEDGEVDLWDANNIMRYVNGTVTLSEQALFIADVNLDGVVDMGDSNLIISYYNGIISLPYF